MHRKLHSLQSMRGIAVMLIVLLHIYAFEAKAGVGAAILPQWLIFGSSGVDLFFVVSGFVMVYTTEGIAGHWRELLKFLYKRITRIYPLYWLLTASLLLAYTLFPQHIHRADLSSVDFTKAILLYPQEHLPYLVVGWTLIHEMYFYLVFSIFILFERKYLPPLLLAWLLTVIALSNTNLSQSSPLIHLIAHPLTLEFILGCFAAILLQNKRAFIPRAIVLFGTLALIGCWVAHQSVTQGAEISGWFRAVLFGVPYSLIVYGATASELNTTRPSNRIFTLLGDASYSIYLLHFLVISCVSKIFAELVSTPSPTVSDNLLYILSCLAASCLLGVASFHYIERKLIRWMRVLPGYCVAKRLASKNLSNGARHEWH